jgi:hypothetical protein
MLQILLLIQLKTKETDGKVVYVEDLEKRKETYENAMNLTQDNVGVNLVMLKDLRKILKIGLAEIKINAVHYSECLEWVPSKYYLYYQRWFYSADWPEGKIRYRDIKNQTCKFKFH